MAQHGAYSSERSDALYWEHAHKCFSQHVQEDMNHDVVVVVVGVDIRWACTM